MSEEATRGKEIKQDIKEPSTRTAGEVGGKPMGPLGIVLILLYLVLFSIVLLYGLLQLWPPATSNGESSSINSAVHFYFWTLKDSDEIRLMLIVALAGALGALVHALRSFYWYVGHRMLLRNWLPFYILRPFIGTTLGLLFYLVIRGGFFSSQATTQEMSPFGFAALAGLVGLFSEQAVLKLKQVAETLLARAPKGEESKPQKEE